MFVYICTYTRVFAELWWLCLQMFTCCYDGFIRLMDVEKETFDLAYSSDDSIFSLSQRPHDMNSLYFGEGQGGLSIWDERVGKCSSSWSLHDFRINTIDFNPVNTNMVATSSTDGTACIWDLRNIAADKPQSLKMVSHGRAVQSAYFSPSGSLLATTWYAILCQGHYVNSFLIKNVDECIHVLETLEHTLGTCTVSLLSMLIININNNWCSYWHSLEILWHSKTTFRDMETSQ